jgi:predicted RNase H-like HicB family nuclease
LQGETVEELQANLREAISGYLEVLQADGRAHDPEI